MAQTEPIKLIVKAPNQQIEDQTFECDASWTVLQLKSHLGQTYPTKPAVTDQKLIYYGQLLSDGLTLREVLRDLNKGQRVHSLHLVCAPPRGGPVFRRPAPPPPVERATPAPSPPTQAARNEPSPSQVPAGPAPSGAAPTPQPSVPEDATWFNASQQQFLAASAQNPAMSAYSAFMPQMYSPANMAQMQLAYSQFMAQYIFHLQQAGIPTETINTLQQGWNMNQGGQPGDRPVEANNAAPQAAAAPQNNLPPQMMDDEMGGNRQRDWLDYFYISSRMLVLISIVYFYSSLHRFLLVTSLGMLLYLYHIGYFNVRAQAPVANNNLPAAENNNRAQDQAVPEAAPPPHQEIPEGLRQRRRDPDAEPEETPDAAAPAPAEQEDATLSANLLWTFFTSFFSSLIPERPQVAA